MVRANSANIFLLLYHTIPLLMGAYYGINITYFFLFYFLFFLGYILGYLLGIKIKVKKFDIKGLGKSHNLFSCIVLITHLISLFILNNLINLDTSPLFYRSIYFKEPLLIFNNNYLYTFYLSILKPSCFMILLYFTVKQKFDLIYWVGIITCLIDAYISQGRFEILYILFFLIISKRFSFLKLILGLLVFIALGVFITLGRRGLILQEYDLNYGDILLHDFGNYFIYGYYFLQRLIITDFFSNNSFFSFSIFASFSNFFKTFFTSKIGIDFHYQWENINLILDKGIVFEPTGDLFNAFATNFAPFYLDFGYLGIVCYSFLIGFIINFKSNDHEFRFLKSLAFFIATFGLFQPIITYFYGLIFFLVISYILFSNVLFKII